MSSAPARGSRTRVVEDTAAGQAAARGPARIILVGGGDPTLAAGRAAGSEYPRPATLAALAAATARALAKQHRAAARIGYDTSLYSGPPMAPGWSPSYVTSGNVTPITALEVNQGRLLRSGKPQDADDPDNLRPRSLTPAADAAAAFAGFLARDGIRVDGPATPAGVPRAATRVAAVSSPPLAAIVEQMLTESNNVIAENLARQVALAKGAPGSFSGAAATVTKVIGRLGAGAGVHLVDGSGLSPDDRIPAATLFRLVSPGRIRRSSRAAGRHHRHAGGGLLRHPDQRAERVRRPGGGRPRPAPGEDGQPGHRGQPGRAGR